MASVAHITSLFDQRMKRFSWKSYIKCIRTGKFCHPTETTPQEWRLLALFCLHTPSFSSEKTNNSIKYVICFSALCLEWFFGGVWFFLGFLKFLVYWSCMSMNCGVILSQFYFKLSLWVKFVSLVYDLLNVALMGWVSSAVYCFCDDPGLMSERKDFHARWEERLVRSRSCREMGKCLLSCLLPPCR